jgi:hypothetical protein
MMRLNTEGFDVSSDQRWMTRTVGDSIVMRTLERGARFAIGAGVSPRFLEDDLLAFRAPDGTLQVGRLTADRSRFAAPPIPMVPNVLRAENGRAVYSVAEDGSLAYVPGTSAGQSRLVWVVGGRERPCLTRRSDPMPGLRCRRTGPRRGIGRVVYAGR